MKKPIPYNITPARGQALLNYQGRRKPDFIELYETNLIEEVRQKKNGNIEDKSIDDFRNLLIHGDCLSACAYLKANNIKVDLVCIDPPFASGANYAKKIFLRNGGKNGIENEDSSIGEEIMYGDIWQKEDYLNWLYERLLAIKEVMSESASIYVHLDWHIGHYVKLLMDEIFGEQNLVNEIIWQRTTNTGSSKALAKKFSSDTDTIYFYAKDIEDFLFNKLYREYTEEYLARFKFEDDRGRYRWSAMKTYSQNKMKELEAKGEVRWGKNSQYPELKQYLDDLKGVPMNNLWNDIFHVNPMADEKVEYATQKPEELLQRIVKASSNEGMLVADFFSGSGTTEKVAFDLKRKFIGCDIGINAIQTTRDRLVEAKAEFDILKVNDGVRLFRNPAQTTAKVFSLIDGFKSRTELEMTEFWDGGIMGSKGTFIPVKFIGIDKRLTKELVDIILEEVYQLQEETEDAQGVKIIYAYKDLDIDQHYINKKLKDDRKSLLKVDLMHIDELLSQKADQLFTPDNAIVEMKHNANHWKVSIKKYFSPYLFSKIEEFNNKKVKKAKQLETEMQEQQDENETSPKQKIIISESGLELIESVQFDTTLHKDEVWRSNIELEDKAGIKEKIKGLYSLPTDKFKIKIRNIAGDEIVIDSEEIKK